MAGTLVKTYFIPKITIPNASEVQKMRDNWRTGLELKGSVNYTDKYVGNPNRFAQKKGEMNRRYGQAFVGGTFTADFQLRQINHFDASAGVMADHYDRYVAQADKDLALAKREAKWGSAVAKTLGASKIWAPEFTSDYSQIITNHSFFPSQVAPIVETMQNLSDGSAFLTRKTTPTADATLAAVATDLATMGLAFLPALSTMTVTLTDLPGFLQADYAITST